MCVQCVLGATIALGSLQLYRYVIKERVDEFRSRRQAEVNDSLSEAIQSPAGAEGQPQGELEPVP